MTDLVAPGGTAPAPVPPAAAVPPDATVPASPAGGPVCTGAGAVRHPAGPVVGELVALLDRVDAVALPVAVRAFDVVRVRVAGVTDSRVDRVRHLGDRLRSSRARPGGTDGAGETERDAPAALLDAVGVTPGGVLDRGARALVLVLVAVIVVSATAAIFQTADHDPSTGAPPAPVIPGAPAGTGASPAGGQQPRTVVPSITIGPGPNDGVADYVGASRQNLAALVADAPGADLYAVASLTAPATPAGLLATFADFRVVQVFFTAGAGGEVEQAAVRDPVADVHAAFTSAAVQADARAAAAGRAGGTGVRDQARQAADALRSGCACLFAAVVRGPAGHLSQLAAEPAVRVVDPAPPGSAPPAVTFVPLSPDRR